MALFEITPEIQRNALPLTPGWYPMEVTKMDEKVPEDPAKFKETVFTHQITDGRDKGRLLWLNVSSDPERMHYGLPYLKFQLGNRKLDPSKKESVNLTLENLANKRFEGYVENRVDKNTGDIRNVISKFRAIGAGAKK